MTDIPDDGNTARRPRERRISRTFIRLADTQVSAFDLADSLNGLAEQCVELLAVPAAGVLLLDPHGNLAAAAPSAQREKLMALFSTGADSGFWADILQSGTAVHCTELHSEPARWPSFTTAAEKCGFKALHALPMRLRERTIGVLILLSSEPGGADSDDLALAQALADIATIGILQHRTIETGDRLNQQLQTALTSRVVIEQAKGVLSHHGSLSMDEAFRRLRRYTRSHNRLLTDLAGSVADGTADLDAILA